MDVQDILDELSDHGFEDTETDRKVAAIQAAIWEVEGRRPWPFLSQAVFLNFDGSSATPTNFPATFRAAIRMKDLTNGRRIRFVRTDDFEDMVGTRHSETGRPELYYFEDGTMKVWPVPPSGTGEVKLQQVRWSAPITASSVEADILIPRYFHRDVLVNGSLFRLFDMEDDSEIAVRFQNQFEKALADMVEAAFALQYDEPEYVHVVDEDWDYAT